MHVGDTLLWGLLATGLLTTLLRASQALHLTRMDTTLLLGTMVTPDKDRRLPHTLFQRLVDG